MNLVGEGDSIGGSSVGDGNVFGGPVAIGGIVTGPAHDPGDFGGAGDVAQGNHFEHQVWISGDHVTFGGTAAAPGTGAGNLITGTVGGQALLVSGYADVIQGNALRGPGTAGIVLTLGDTVVDGSARAVLTGHDTIGGATPSLGNEISGYGVRGSGEPAGIWIDSSIDDVIEHNTFRNDHGEGDVLVGDPVTGPRGATDNIHEDIYANEMDSEPSPAINLGGGAFRPDGASGAESFGGPNHFEPYPQLFSTTPRSRRRVEITGQLLGTVTPGDVRVDVYSLPQCSPAGSGDFHYLGSKYVRSGLLSTDFTLDINSGGAQAFALTATSAAGDTSEISPCIKLGQNLNEFAHAGVVIQGASVTQTTSSAALDLAAAARATRKHVTYRGSLYLFCPPKTTGRCAGSITIRTTGRPSRLIAVISLRLKPDRTGATGFPIPASIAQTLAAGRTATILVTIKAHDSAKPAHRKTTQVRLALRTT